MFLFSIRFVFLLKRKTVPVFFLSTWTVIDPRLVLSVFMEPVVEKLASMGVMEEVFTDGGEDVRKGAVAHPRCRGRRPGGQTHKTLSQLGCHTSRIPSERTALRHSGPSLSLIHI